LYLKHITLRGFKSFKNKSQLFFEPGVSIVVGPNGSGKSNIADAISWVLGEQSPKSLRGSSMGDVIFRSKEEEMGIAEVSLMFDNSDNLFKTEFRDVKFTRRVFARGGSEYFINSSPCRLLDIQEMTADSGIGKGLNIIINQGQINDIAVLKPIERKIIIDEILGISKHKVRRDKSIAKLQKVRSDIDRVNDLMEEIKRTMDPLEIEARRAQKYAELSNYLKKEEISLFIARLKKLNKSWESENKNYEDSKRKLKETEEEILKVENEKEDLLKLIDKKSGEYEFWKNKTDCFNSESKNLSSIAALIESKNNVFGTLYNMFDLELAGLASGKKNIEESTGQNVDDALANYYEEISNGLKKVNELILNFMTKLKEKIKDKEILYYIENVGKSIIEELKSLNKKAEEGLKKEISGNLGMGSSKKSSGDAAGFKESLDRIKLVKEICMTNLKRSQRLSLLLGKYIAASEKIKRSLYPEFERGKDLLSNDRSRISELDGKKGQLNAFRLSLENNIYKSDLRKEQIKENVKTITDSISDDYNLSMEYALKNYSPCSDIEQSQSRVKKIKSQIKKYGSVNPNAAVEYGKIKKRFDFLAKQRLDLVESGKNLEELIRDINKKIADFFYKKFDEINKCFKNYFKVLFPLGEGEMTLEKNREDNGDEMGIDLKVDIGNNKFVPISLLSGGEKSLVSLAFLFSIYSINPSPFYVFDEVDAALDDVNIGRFLTLIRKFSEKQQIIIITHQKRTMEIADTIYGVTMQSNGISKIISEKIEKYAKVN
jgi:chromosome segregation ATPase